MVNRIVRLKEDKVKILVIEDDQKTASYLKQGLNEQGHVVDLATNGEDGFYFLAQSSYDVLIIDRMLPDTTGTEIISRLRSNQVNTPILMLTAMGSIEDKVTGFKVGADDYLVKPFAFAELSARIYSLARRPQAQQHSTLKIKDLEIDLLKHVVKRAGKVIELQPTEFRLLEFLARRAGQVVTRTMLLEGVWDFHFDPKTSVVETHISRLRTKIDKPFATPLLRTVRGAGYTIDTTD